MSSSASASRTFVPRSVWLGGANARHSRSRCRIAKADIRIFERCLTGIRRRKIVNGPEMGVSHELGMAAKDTWPLRSFRS